jgi:hypothetical protein
MRASTTAATPKTTTTATTTSIVVTQKTPTTPPTRATSTRTAKTTTTTTTTMATTTTTTTTKTLTTTLSTTKKTLATTTAVAATTTTTTSVHIILQTGFKSSLPTTDFNRTTVGVDTVEQQTKHIGFVPATFLTTKNRSMDIETTTTAIPYIVKTPFPMMPITSADILSTTTNSENHLSTLRGMDDYYYYYYNNIKRRV